jgi:hypothetical protein
MKVRKNISVEPLPFEELQKLVPNVSAEINGFVKRRVAELSGKPVDGTGDYGELKDELDKKAIQVARLMKRLSEQADAYGEANHLLAELGIKDDMSNASEVISKFMLAWKGGQEFMHQYITLIETAQKKKQVEQRLKEIRDALYGSVAKPAIIVSELTAPDSVAVPVAS